MNRSPDILFTTEYIKNVLYFATVRQGKVLKNTADTHYFCIDNELVYENYYSDFGPLNLGCVYKYCRLLNDKLKQFLNKQTIVHYTSIDPKKKANSAFLLGCYGVLYLSLSPRDALKPLVVHGQSYRPFQDATQGESAFTISLMDCLQAIKKARELGFFNFQDFNYEEYDRLDKIQGGDLNWIVPGKFLAFIGPVDYSVSLFHPPEMYISYFLENNVKIVIRLNKRLYDGNVFNNVGIIHYDLFFPDGSCPPRHILFKFLQISEEASCALAVHCKAGLGRTGSLIGCYLIKHYRMTSHEAIGWMRICRPGSVIGHQQGWLEQLEPWLTKQGNLYRKRTYQDTEKLPLHEFGVYSIAEKNMKQRPVVFHKSPSPPPPIQKQVRPTDGSSPVRQQNSRIKEESDAKSKPEEDEVFLTSCDLTLTPTKTEPRGKGCVIRSNVSEEPDDSVHSSARFAGWKNYFQACLKKLNDHWWMLSVRCVGSSPKCCNGTWLCCLLDRATEKECDWRVKSYGLNNSSQKIMFRGDHRDQRDSLINASRRSSGAGEPKGGRPTSRASTARTQPSRDSFKSSEPESKTYHIDTPITTYRTSQAPVIKNVNDARNYLMRTSIYNSEREKHLNAAVTVTPQQYGIRQQSPSPVGNRAYVTPAFDRTVPKASPALQTRRRLGRSPSPPARMCNEQSRATNTPSPAEKFLVKDASKTALKDVLSRLRLSMCRDGSLGAASLGATRDAPAPSRAPSVRSDERPLATQGDMLNSIKLQRRMRETLTTDKTGLFRDKVCLGPKNPCNNNNIKNEISRNNNNFLTKPSNQDFGLGPKNPCNNNNIKNETSRNNNNFLTKPSNQDFGISKDKQQPPITRSFNNHPARPMSPKGRQNAQTNSFF